MLCFEASKRCKIGAVLSHRYFVGGETVTTDQIGRDLKKHREQNAAQLGHLAAKIDGSVLDSALRNVTGLESKIEHAASEVRSRVRFV